MTQWDEQLAAKVRAIPSLARTAAIFKTTNETWLRKYRGGMPMGLLAATAAIESSGRMVAGDANLGEYGYFQIAAQTERDFGVPVGTRTGAEGNIFLAGLEYNVEAKRLALKYPGYVRDGSKGQWQLARLVFAIGRNGTDICMRHAIQGGFMGVGQGFAGVSAWARATGGVKIGSSEAGKIAYRVRLIDEVTQPVADLIAPGERPGVPVAPPAPLGLTYTLPKDVRDKLGSASNATSMLVAGVLVAGALYLLA